MSELRITFDSCAGFVDGHAGPDLCRWASGSPNLFFVPVVKLRLHC